MSYFQEIKLKSQTEETLVDETNQTATNYFVEFDTEGFQNLAVFLSWETDWIATSFKVYESLLDSPTVPATGGSANPLERKEKTICIWGLDEVQLKDSIEVKYIRWDLPTKYLIEYSLDNATNDTKILIRKY